MSRDTNSVVDRRTLLRVALAAPAVGALASCAKPDADKSTPAVQSGTKVDGSKPLEFFNFDGGCGKAWTTMPLDLYRKDFPQVKLLFGHTRFGEHRCDAGLSQ